MFLNYGSGGSSGGSGGGSVINVTGSQNNIKVTTAEMNAIPSPKNGDICHITSTKELYMFKDGTWTVIPTGDAFYNKLSTTTQIGHVQLTSDITSTSEELAITPKALNTAITDAIEEVKLLIDSNSDNEWGDWNDGVEETEGDTDFEWGNFG